MYPLLEPLDSRVMLSITALSTGGELRVTGDDQDNVIMISRTVGGSILVNNGAVPITGGVATVANTTHLHLVGAGGNDNISLDESNGLLPGADLFGGAGNDTLIGGSGSDFADGEAGNDLITLEEGDDNFQWNPGDGSDVVDAGTGHDEMIFNGSDQAERIDVSDSGAGLPIHHVRLTRDVGTVGMDLLGFESIDLNAFGGADTITVSDLSATDVSTVNLDLSSSGATGDGLADAIILNGSIHDDHAQVQSTGTGVSASAGLFPLLNINGSEADRDTLTLNTLGGDDTIDASSLAAGVIGLAINGGAGSDEIVGSPGNDSITGGAGDDKINMGGGDDAFTWNSGDGSDTVDGDGGTDTLNFNGSAANENIALSASASRLQLTDDADGINLDVGGIEQTSVAPLGGADHVTIGDLTGTAQSIIKVKLNADGASDNVTVTGSNGADTVHVDGDFSNGVTVIGLATQVNVIGALGATDGLTVNAQGGADNIDASTLEAGALNLTINGGDGNDSITGSQGADIINGGAGTDTINIIGDVASGATTLQGSTGDDAVNVNADGIGSAKVAFDATQRIGALAVGSGGVATLTAGGAKALTVTSLNITGSGKLDLNDNALIVDYAANVPPASSPIGSVGSLLASGYHGGLWNGSGIMTSLGNASNFALGFAEASDVSVGGKFGGQFVDSTAVVVKLALYGDANLDGKVDFLDLAKLAQSYNTTVLGATGGTWMRGDFNYDGVTDFLDLAQLAQHYNTASPAMATTTTTGAMPSVASVLAQATGQSPDPVPSKIAAQAATATKVSPKPVPKAKPKLARRIGR
jgi:hypothetical protein